MFKFSQMYMRVKIIVTCNIYAYPLKNIPGVASALYYYTNLAHRWNVKNGVQESTGGDAHMKMSISQVEILYTLGGCTMGR